MTTKQVKANKVELCATLSTMTKSQAKKELPSLAKTLGLKVEQARNAWSTFNQDGDPHRSYIHGKYVGTYNEHISNWQKENYTILWQPERKLTYKEKISIFKSYFFDTDMRTIDVLESHNIGKTQFYALLKDLRVYGKVGSKKILTWDKHVKFDVEDVRRFNKVKSFRSKTNSVHYVRVKRLDKILRDYLK